MFMLPGLVLSENSYFLNGQPWPFMAIEIVDLPINSMVMFHSYVNVDQRVRSWMSRMLEDPQICVCG